MKEPINKFIDAMRADGIGPESAADVIADDKPHYYRIEGDKPGVKKGSYCLRVDDDGFACGWYMSMRDGNVIRWHSKSTRKASEEERAAWEKKRDEAKAKQEEERKAAHMQAAERAAAMWSQGVDAKSHPYATRKQMRVDGLRVWTDLDRMEDVLLVPVLKNGRMTGLQRIYDDGEKLFTAGADTAGGHVWIGSPDGAPVVAIGEGYATCDSVAQAMGWPVCVAFNAGNLRAVAEMVRAGWPDARVILLADEDRWTWDAKHRAKRPEVLPDHDAPEWDEWRANGWLRNVGRVAAEQAAMAIGGAQVIGVAEGGDWNDLHCSEGLDAVRDRLQPPVDVPIYEPEPWVPDEVGPTWEEAATPMQRIKEEVRPQGYIGKVYYFFPRSTGDIESLTTGDMKSDLNLYHLARESFWKGFFDKPDATTGKEVVAMFSPKLMEMCKDAGKFDTDRVMSTGVWVDSGKGIVANMGDKLYIPVDGFMDHSDYVSENVYVSAPKTVDLHVEALRNSDAVKLREICESLNWKHRISGSLLAGWIYASILSGVLRWRPHIFITGGKGSGKTTVMQKVIKRILKGWSTNADGGTTAAGFRKKLGNKSSPVVSDEMETETEGQRKNADDVLFLARQSSSGAEYSNAYVDITVHSCFCFGGISPNIKNGADKDRITVMELVPDRAPGFRARWKEKERVIDEVLTGDYGRRLIKRAIDNAPAFLDNLAVFEDELADLLGSSRSAEQFAPMIAGLYSLHSTGRIDRAKAAEWVKAQDWEFFREEEDGSDAEKMVSHLMTAMADFTVGDRTNKVAVSALIAMVIDGGVSAASAVNALGRYGLKVDGDWLIVANSKSRIGELMKDTPWTVPKNTLGRYHGAESVGTTYFAAGVTSRGIRIPMRGLIDRRVAEEVELEWE